MSPGGQLCESSALKSLGQGAAFPGAEPTLTAPKIIEIGSNFVVVSCPKDFQHLCTASKQVWPTNSAPVCLSLEYRKVSSPHEAIARSANWTNILFQAKQTIRVPSLEADTLYAVRLRCDTGAAASNVADSKMASVELTSPDKMRHPAQYSHMTMIQTQKGVPAEPHPPAVMSCTTSSLHLCWAAPMAPSDSLPLSYRLMCQVCEGTPSAMHAGQWMVVYEGPNTEVLIPGLCPAGQYNFKLQAINRAGAGPCSSVVRHMTMAGMPGPPGDLRIVAMTATSLTLAWDAAAEHGRSVSRYVLEYMLQGGSGWLLAMADLQISCEVAGLTPGQVYVFRVRADNANGMGLWARPLVARVHDRPLPPPENVTVMDWTRTAATIHWRAPPSQVPHLRYEAQLCAITTFAQAQWRAALREGVMEAEAAQGARGWSTVYYAASAGCRVDKLQPGCQYCFRVRTVADGLGGGRWSQSVKIITKPGVPAAPTQLECQEATQTSLTLTWPTPPHNGGLRVVAYEISLARPHAATTGAPCGTSADALADASLYDWQCHIKNVTRPASNASSFTYTVTSLRPGQRFYARVRARNAEGESPWTPFFETATPAGVPTTPDAEHLSGHESLTDDARTIAVQACGEPQWQSHTVDAPGATAVQLTQLGPGSTYEVCVSADNAAGMSQRSPSATVSTLGAVPLPPPEVVEVAAATAVLRWGAPEVRATAAGQLHVEVAVAKVPHSPGGGSGAEPPHAARLAWHAVYRGCESACLVSGLSPGSAYAFRMREVSPDGRGCADGGGGAEGETAAAWSACATATTLLTAPPPPVAVVAGARAPTSIRLSWRSQLKAGCAAAQAFRIEAAAYDGDFEVVAACSETTHHLKGLQPNTPYRVRIAAETACGHPGGWSETLAVATPPLPPLPPSGVTVDALPGSFRKGKPTCTLAVLWDAVAAGTNSNGGHAAPAFYEAEAMEEVSRAVRARHMSNKPVAAAALHGLHPGAVYCVRVRAVAAGAVGASSWSAVTRIETPQPASLVATISLASSPRTLSSDLYVADSRCALEVQSQSSEGYEGGSPRCSILTASGTTNGSPAAAGCVAPPATAAAPPRKTSPPSTAAPAARKRAGAAARQRTAGAAARQRTAGAAAAPTARAPPRRRARVSTHLRRHLLLAIALLALCAIGIAAFAVARSA
eukprot:jgi/Ulvmu1/8761/UM048_0016.1